MSSRRDDVPELSSGDEALVRQVADAWTPEPMTPAQRAAFDARLLGRVESGRAPRRWLWPGLVPAAAAAALALLWLAPGRAPEGVVSPAAPSESLLSARDWEEGLLLGEPEESDGALASDDLPEEYLAIASVFLDG